MKNIVIIGASSGIGLATARRMAGEHNLFTVARHHSEALAAINTRFTAADVTSQPLDVNTFPDEIHGLLYCPGSITLKPFTRLSKTDFESDYRINVITAATIIQQFIPAMKRAGGASVVLFSTVAVKTGMPFHASIAAAKGAVEGMARSLAAELAPSNIRVNVIAPSLTDTSLAAHLLNTPEKKEAAARRHPLQRIGDAGETAELVAFLLSEKSSWITGQIIGIDGGIGSLKV